MEKSALLKSLILLVFSPAYLYAQEIELPAVVIKGKRDAIPSKVKNAFIEEFGAGHIPVQWVNSNTTFRITLDDQNIDPGSTEINMYSFHTKTNTGWTLDASYNPVGKLISSREYLKNFKPGHNVIMALKNSDFRDWFLKKDFQIIENFPSGASRERYALVVQKGNKKKTIYFDKQGKILMNSDKELAIADR